MFVTVARRSTHPPLSPLSLDGQPLPQILSAYLFIFYSVYLHSRAFGPTQQTCIYAPCCSKRCRRIITHTVLVPNKPLVFICPPPHQPISPHVLVSHYYSFHISLIHTMDQVQGRNSHLAHLNLYVLMSEISREYEPFDQCRCYKLFLFFCAAINVHLQYRKEKKVFYRYHLSLLHSAQRK